MEYMKTIIILWKMVTGMKSSIINFLILLCILVVGAYFTFRALSKIKIPVIKDVQVIPKYVDKIIVKGTVKKEPYVIVLKNTDNQAMDFTFDYDASQLPKDMYVTSVDTVTNFDYLSPIRVGYAFIGNSEQKASVTLAYNPIRYKSLEIGIITAFDSVGVDIGIRYRNIGLNVFYQANNEYGFGIMVKVF